MATNIEAIICNLYNLFNFNDKIILTVGAGGGQFIDYGCVAKKVIAIDQDISAIETLRNRVLQKGLINKFEIMRSDFFETNSYADVVLFEFSLHEIENSKRAIQHAQSLAPDIVILDHALNSEWAYYIDEEMKIKNSLESIQAYSPYTQNTFHSEQFFNNYQELFNKVSSQGETAIQRIEKFKNITPIHIPMSYSITHIHHPRH